MEKLLAAFWVSKSMFLDDMIEGDLGDYKIVEYYGSSKSSEARTNTG